VSLLQIKCKNNFDEKSGNSPAFFSGNPVNQRISINFLPSGTIHGILLLNILNLKEKQ